MSTQEEISAITGLNLKNGSKLVLRATNMTNQTEKIQDGGRVRGR